MRGELAGKVAIVTGAGRGVAKGVAMAFARAGAKLVIVDRDGDTGATSEAELRAAGGEAVFAHVDLADRAALPGIVALAVERFGRLDVLVNAAQASRQLLFNDTTVEAMNFAFDTGFWPTFLLMQAAFSQLAANQGAVINFASGAGLEGMPTQASYGAAKEAIRAISKVAANEWGPKGVRVNVVCPFAMSPGVEAWSQAFPDAFNGQIAKVPLRRIGDPEKDIGAACVFLASDAARYVTGQTLMVDGGQTRPL